MQVACKCFHICSSMFPLSYQVALVGKRFAKKSEYFLALKHFLYCLIHFLHSVSLLAMHICTQPFLDLFSSEPSLHNTSVTSASSNWRATSPPKSPRTHNKAANFPHPGPAAHSDALMCSAGVAAPHGVHFPSKSIQ